MNDIRVPCAGEPRCTTRLQNAHNTEFRELLYPWHPWSGLRIGIHEAIERPGGVLFRCAVELLIDTVVRLTLAKWETVSGRFGGYLTGPTETTDWWRLLILLSQKVATNDEENHLFGKIHTSAMGGWNGSAKIE
ncbi:MAG TPA: hypothetical protein VKM94_03815 [Blastocatellia bacterium]|nr:hypothetical protein [Blastocatellia bacterium]